MRTPQINTMAALAHENVSQVYTTIQEHGCTNLVMEIIGGGELFDTVKLWKRDTRERLTFHYFNQLMTGLKFLHSAGFAHRDLKLENLLLTTDGLLKIADFGVTKSLEFNPMKTCCGSPDYIAPELITSQRGYDGRLADIWSCGVILYAMLAGEFPFENASKILKGQYKTPKWFPKMAKESLLDKILVVDPKQRIQSVEEIMDTEWMHEFSAERNSFSMYLDTCRQMRANKEGISDNDSFARSPASRSSPIESRGRSMEISSPIQRTASPLSRMLPSLRCRYMFLKVLLTVKVILALRRPSIKGVPRDMRLVFIDRLNAVLGILQDSIQKTSGSKQLDWKQARESPQYSIFLNLLGEAQRAQFTNLNSDDRLAAFLNLYHIVTIHGFAAHSEHMGAWKKDKQQQFFDSTTFVVGFMQWSLNDIFHGILRGNQPKPGGGLWGNHAQIDPKLYPEKLEAAVWSEERPFDPVIHFVVSHLSISCPTVTVFQGSSVHEQMKSVARMHLQQHVRVDVKRKLIHLPMPFKEFAKDFGGKPVELIAWVRGYLKEEEQAKLDSICKNGVCAITYEHRDWSFEWRSLPQVGLHRKQQDIRFRWTEEKRTAWVNRNPHQFALKTFCPNKDPLKTPTGQPGHCQENPSNLADSPLASLHSPDTESSSPKKKKRAKKPEAVEVGWTNEDEGDGLTVRSSPLAAVDVSTPIESPTRKSKTKKKEKRVAKQTHSSSSLASPETSPLTFIQPGLEPEAGFDASHPVLANEDELPESTQMRSSSRYSSPGRNESDAVGDCEQDGIGSKTSSPSHLVLQSPHEMVAEVSDAVQSAEKKKKKKKKDKKAGVEKEKADDSTSISSPDMMPGVKTLHSPRMKTARPSNKGSPPHHRSESPVIQHPVRDAKAMQFDTEVDSLSPAEEVPEVSSQGFQAGDELGYHTLEEGSFEATTSSSVKQTVPGASASKLEVQNAARILTDPLKGPRKVMVDELGTALVLVSTEDGQTETQKLTLEERLGLMQTSHLECRRTLMQKYNQPKLMAQVLPETSVHRP